MSRSSIQKMVDEGVIFTPLELGVTKITIDRNNPYIRRIDMERNDSISFILQVIESLSTPSMVISFYRLVDKRVTNYATRNNLAWTYAFNQELLAETYIMEIVNNDNLIINITANTAGFTPSAKMTFSYYAGSSFDGGDLSVTRRPIECKESLGYELIDGELPPGLKLGKTGLITGVIENLDCIIENDINPEEYSPSFNWFYSNHDGMAQSWARRWRFKVRVTIESMPDTFIDEWFCIKVFNNWSLDAAVFDAMTDEDTIIIDDIKSVSLPNIQKPMPKESTNFVPSGLTMVPDYYTPVVDCLPCNDPTTPSDTEYYKISDGLRIRTPNELIDYYSKHQSNFEPLIMQLHNSIILHDYLKTIGVENRNPNEIYEILINGENLTLNKYYLNNGRSFLDTDQNMLSQRTIKNQVAPIDIVMTMGETMKGVLQW